MGIQSRACIETGRCGFRVGIRDRQRHTHTAPSQESFMEHIKNISTAHAHAQANLVGKLPNRSLWGVFIPAGDLLHCALPGPFLSTLHTDLGHTLSARLLYLCSARSEGKKAGSPCFTSASGGSWPLTRVCVCVVCFQAVISRSCSRGFPGGPVVKTPSS